MRVTDIAIDNQALCLMRFTQDEKVMIYLAGDCRSCRHPTGSLRRNACGATTYVSYYGHHDCEPHPLRADDERNLRLVASAAPSRGVFNSLHLKPRIPISCEFSDMMSTHSTTWPYCPSDTPSLKTSSFSGFALVFFSKTLI